MADNELMEDLSADNSQALETLFNKYYKILVIFALNYVKDRAIAEDLVQDVFVMIFEKRKSLRIHTSIKAFLYTAVRNHTLNYLKKSKPLILDKNSFEDNTEISENQLEPEECMGIAELSEKLYRAIDQLPHQNQKIFKLSKLEGYSNQEIADHLGLTKRTVETHISNALKKLRSLVKEILLMVFFTCLWFLVVIVSNKGSWI